MINPKHFNPKHVNTIGSVSRRSAAADAARGKNIGTSVVPSPAGVEWDGPHHAVALRPIEGGWGGWSDTGTPPWTPGHDLSLVGNGGIYIRERHRQTIAAVLYQSHVAGDRVVEVGGDSVLNVARNATFSTSTDKLRVEGDAFWRTDDKLTLGRGNVNRRWEGAIMRKIGMEGVIAGGAFLKTFTGMSMTLTPLASGDVYGGAAQAAGVRVRMTAHMGYRSTEMCSWACGVFLRSCQTMIEPIAGSPAADMPRKKLAKAGRIGLGLCPVADILFGLCMMPVSIAMAIRAKVKGIKRPDTPQGQPRTHIRTVGTTAQGRVSDKIM